MSEAPTDNGSQKLLDVGAQSDGDGVVALTLEGELDLATSPKVRQPLEAAIDRGERLIVLDMLKCTFIDSTGLGILLSGAKRLEGGGMAIVCVDEQIRRLLGMTMIDRTIPVFDSRDEARAHLLGLEPAGDAASG